MAWARAAIVTDADGSRAIERALEMTGGADAPPTDLVLLFANPAYGDELTTMVRMAYRESGASVLIGCTGQGVIGTAREVEAEPAVSLLRLSLPRTRLESVHLTQPAIAALVPLSREQPPPNGWIVFADPFHLEAETLLARLESEFPSATVVGGMASGDPHSRTTHVFLNGQVYAEGAVALAIRGAARLHAVVSQGCTPVGQVWTVTSARQNVLETIGNRPAYEVLVETVRALPPDIQRRVRGNVFVGLAMNEYRDAFDRGDFLIRGILGGDQEKGLVAIGAQAKVGQTLQFQLRDRAAADEELRVLLANTSERLGTESPVAGLLCSCNGRGVGLFGEPDHDAQAIGEYFGSLPLAGFFCNGEIGPVGGKLFLHGYTASIALLTEDAEQPPNDPPPRRAP